MRKAVLFDLDGTLVNSLGDLARGVNHALAAEGFPPHAEEEFRRFAGDGIPKMIERALPEHARGGEIHARCVARFLEYYAAHYADTTRAYDGVTELLDALNHAGLRLAVVSNKAQEMAERVVRGIFGDRFGCIIGKREGVPAKPDPAALLLGARALSVPPEDCVFLGDSGMDMAAAVRAGMLPVGVLWGFRGAAELKENGARYLLSRPQELDAVLAQDEENKT